MTGAAEFVMILIVGGLTGWLANVSVETDVPMNALATIPVGGVGSLLGVAIVAGLGVQPRSMESWTIVAATARWHVRRDDPR